MKIMKLFHKLAVAYQLTIKLNILKQKLRTFQQNISQRDHSFLDSFAWIFWNTHLQSNHLIFLFNTPPWALQMNFKNTLSLISNSCKVKGELKHVAIWNMPILCLYLTKYLTSMEWKLQSGLMLFYWV